MILWIASGNASKIKELKDFASRFLPCLSEIRSREPKGVIENEPTFEGNARLKARALTAELLAEGQRNFQVLGDDSGLCVDLLDGRPGVFSARYSAAGANSRENLEKVLQELSAITLDLERRTGAYRCALSLTQVVDGRMTGEYSSHGERGGLIATASRGENGYAYDSVFLDPQTLRSYGEMSYEEKQIDSHRQRAFENMRRRLESRLP
jgi:XTP/dITP diphosphohydrolase